MILKRLKTRIDNLLHKLTYRQKFIFLAVVFMLSANTPGFWIFRTIDLFSNQNKIKSEGIDYLVVTNKILADVALYSVLSNKPEREGLAPSLHSSTLADTITTAIGRLSYTFKNAPPLEKSNVIEGGYFEISVQNNFSSTKEAWEVIYRYPSQEALIPLYTAFFTSINDDILKISLQYDVLLSNETVPSILARSLTIDIPESNEMVARLYLLLRYHSVSKQKEIQETAALLLANMRHLQMRLAAAYTEAIRENEVSVTLMNQVLSTLDSLLNDAKLLINHDHEPHPERILIRYLQNSNAYIDMASNLVKLNIRANQTDLNWVWGGIVFLIALGVLHVLFYSLFHVLSGHLLKLMQYVTEITRGNFSFQLNMNTKDSVGKIGAAIFDMGQALNLFIGQMQIVVSQLSDFSKKIIRMTTSQYQLIAAQEKDLRTLEETNREMAVKSEKLSDAMNVIMTASAEMMTEEGIHPELISVQNTMEDLVASSEKILENLDIMKHNVMRAFALIGSIIKVSDEAHLLALNASIEVLDTGTHRQTFTDISRSIQLFADMSAESTREIHSIFEEMIARITEARSITKNCISKINSSLGRLIVVCQQAGTITEESRIQSLKFQDINRIVNQQTESVNSIIESLSHLNEEARKNTVAISDLQNTVIDLACNTEDFENIINQFFAYHTNRRQIPE